MNNWNGIEYIRPRGHGRYLESSPNILMSRFRDLLLCQNDRIVYPTTVLRWKIGRPIERYLEKKKFSSGSRKYCVSGFSLIHA